MGGREKEIRDNRKWEGYCETLYLKGARKPFLFPGFEGSQAVLGRSSGKGTFERG
jgi:hypothetical protein